MKLQIALLIISILTANCFQTGQANVLPNAFPPVSETDNPQICFLSSSKEVVDSQTNEWILIPEWLSGTWRAKSEIILQSYDYRRGANVVTEPLRIKIDRISTIGMQRDSHGRIWHYVATPYKRVIETDGFKEIQQIQKVSLEKFSTEDVVMTFIATVTRIDKKTDEIIDMFIEETNTTYMPIEKGLNQVAFIISDFDMQGNPIFSSKAVCTEKRIVPFEISNEYRGENLQDKFKEFLKKQGKSDLSPKSP